MSSVSHDYIEDYIRGLIKDNEGYIKTMEDYAIENHVPIIHKEVAQFLRVIIKSHNIKNILEVGTAIGYSASVMVNAAGNNSHVTTIERSDEMEAIAVENIKKIGYDKNITLIKGDALEVLGDVKGEFDMIFLDAAKGHYDHFLEQCLEKLKVGGLLISDNVLFRGMVATNDLLIRRKITIVKRMRKYLENISNDKNLETVILPIGDGIALTCKIGSGKNE
ncbi:O-methyltransferase [Clostridium cylindrosporum]|uniref:tRNA 5-hydroxyuridine methyltransferase n=1 Tax=Clostridium cylindrosporum DSM 605 TaxID=1121307 RepID=A0A0J8D630_CLOCY|nr:O-methyltransferase [Clostridium cylindrosporum]KMT21312.1 putative O-methyltransferase YrrM [Clostridium cylindrosporum DSM 605]